MTLHLSAKNGTVCELRVRTVTVLSAEGCIVAHDHGGTEARYKLSDLVAVSVEDVP